MRGTRAALGLLLAVAGSGAAAAAGDGPTYVGAGSCAASNCHGSALPRRDSQISLQNEYLTWYKQDGHAKAFGVLLEERSFKIARRLGMAPAGSGPDNWLWQTAHPERCLDCHTLNAPEASRGPKFDAQDAISREGVSCEACHGAAGGWIERHTEAGWTPERSVELGMFDTRDPKVTAEVCLSCHLGSATKRVDHDLIGAGHPALAFELDTFASNLPAHWVENPGNARWYRGQPWLVGQAVTLREAARHLERQVRAGGWPDFAAYDCSACHHDLRPQSRWRQDRGAGTPGRPPWEEARYAVFSRVVHVLTPDLAGPMDGAVRRLDRLAREARGGSELGASAGAVAEVADGFLDRVAPLDAERIDEVVRAIVGDGNRLAYSGFRTAQQVAWGLDSLAVARASLAGQGTHGAPETDGMRGAIGRLIDGLGDPASYDPARFARDVESLPVGSDR